jgi:hypothetical protein
MVDRFRCVELFEAALVEDSYPVGHSKRLVMVVGDEDGGRGSPFEEAEKLFPHFRRHVRIEVAKRLIKQEDHWLLHKSSGQGHPLLLAAGELVGIAFGQVHKAYHFEHHADLTCSFRGWQAVQSECNIVCDAQMGEERIVLEDHPDMPMLGREHMPWCRDQPTIQIDLAGAYSFKPCYGP